MKHIYKKISLNQFKSMLPSTIKSYYYFKKFYEFDGKTDFDENGKKPYINYGLIPFFIKWKGGIYNDLTISFYTLTKWYHFLEFYINLLKRNNCAMSYVSNAYEYYNVTTDPQYSIDECIEFDTKITNLCGESNDNLLSAKEKLKELENLYFPKFEIVDENLQNKWKKKYLSINEVNYWIKWFTERKDLYQTIDDCKTNSETIDCCDCEKFFNLGGVDFLNKLIEFIDNLTIEKNFQEPFFNVNILITNKINNLGEFSILAEEWESGTDYSSNIEMNDTIINNGAIVSYNNNDWVLDHGKGYIYSNIFKEIYFGSVDGMTEQEKLNYQDMDQDKILTDNKQFIRLIEKNAKNNIFMFNGNIDDNYHYTYDYDNKKYFYHNNLSDEDIYNIFKSYEIKENIIDNINCGFFYINGSIYNINKGKFIKYNGIPYIIQYDESNNPFININGLLYFATFNDDNGCYMFTINNTNINILNDEYYYITIKDKIFIINDTWTITINRITYPRILHYSIINGLYVIFNETNDIVTPIINNNNIEYVIDEITFSKHLLIEDINNLSRGYLINDNKIYIIKPYVEYNVNILTGYTESKLSSFLSATDVMYDNLGNKLPGSIENSDIKEGSILGLLYKPNTMIHASKTQVTVNDQILDAYWCDFLDKIEIYYTNDSNEIITDICYLSNDENLNDILQKLEEKMLFDDINLNGNLTAKFTYYMGCDLLVDHKEDTNDLIYTIINQGVKYVETMLLEKKDYQYFIDNYTYYTVKYYDLIGEKINYINSNYDYSSTVNKAYFSFPITQFVKDGKFYDNGWVDFPVCKEEYKNGSSSLENIESDIYIDRGTAKSFDSHLKLMEVNSLESLEQYGNGFFNIITN